MPIVASPGEDENPHESPPREGESRGGDFGNTHLANRQVGLMAGCEDTVEFSLGIKWRSYFALVDVLNAAKAKAQETDVDAVEVRYGDAVFAVHRKGRASGGGRGVYFAFKLEAYGLALTIAEQSSPIEETPNVRVLVGSKTLMLLGGLHSAWPHVLRVLDCLGGDLAWDKLSRVDPCVDVLTVDTHELVKLVETGHMVARAQTSDLHRYKERYTGITVGKGGSILLRIYDKAHEVYRVKRDAEKACLLEELRWGGAVESALRAEYQMRRAALRELGLDTVSNYIRNRPGALRYLTEEWFRVTAELPDRENNNTQRMTTHETWQIVQRTFADTYGRANICGTRVNPSQTRNADKNAKLFLGSGLGAVADLTRGGRVLAGDVRQRLAQVLGLVAGEYSDEELFRRYEAKAALIRARQVSWRERK